MVYKAYDHVFHDGLGKIQCLKDLNWKPNEQLIERIENGPVPLEREMITPESIAESSKLFIVYNALKNNPTSRCTGAGYAGPVISDVRPLNIKLKTYDQSDFINIISLWIVFHYRNIPVYSNEVYEIYSI